MKERWIVEAENNARDLAKYYMSRLLMKLMNYVLSESGTLKKSFNICGQKDIYDAIRNGTPLKG